jgi:hypothetical protein
MSRDVDQEIWFQSPGGLAFVAEHGGLERARAVLSAAGVAEVKAARDFIDDYETVYGRRPGLDEIRYHPSVRADLSAPFAGTSREFADALKWVDPKRPVLVADEAPDVSSLRIR